MISDHQNDWAIWLIIMVVFLIVFGTVLAVLSNAKDKPSGPQALVAAVFNQGPVFNLWKNGTGTQPILARPMSRPVAFESLQWKPLYLCPLDGAAGAPVFDSTGKPYCPLCGQMMVMNR
jgi:hypothetical protein